MEDVKLGESGRHLVDDLSSGLDEDIALECCLDLVGVLKDIFDGIGPFLEEAMLDIIVEGLLQLAVLGLSIVLRGVVWHKVHAIDGKFGAVDSADK